MSNAVSAGGSRYPLESFFHQQLSSPLALSGTIPAATVDIATERFTGVSPLAKRPPLLSYNSTDTVSTRASESFSASPSAISTPYYPGMAGPSTTQQGFSFYEQYPITPTYELQHTPLASGLVGFDIAALEEKSNATRTPAQTNQAESEGEGEADSSGTNNDKGFLQTFYDINQVKHRRRTTTAQLEVLDAYFQESPKPNMETRREISSKLSMTLREVQVWFQNRRAKQKKIENRAAIEAERALSAPLLSPTTLTPVTQRPFVYRPYTTSTTEQPMPSYGTQAPSFGNMQTSLPFAGSDANQQASRDTSYLSANLQAQIPRQPQQSAYIGNFNSSFNSLGPAFQHPHNEPAWSSSSYNAQPQYNFNAGNMSGWTSNQTQQFGQNTFSQADSVSPASSRSSSQDLGQTMQRRGSTVPPALSNLSGLSMTPNDDSQHSPTAAISSYFSGVPSAPATVPLDASAVTASRMYSGDALNLGSYQAMQPAYTGSTILPITAATSPIAPTFPMLSPTTSLFPANMAYFSTLGMMQPYAPMPLYNGGQFIQQIPQYVGEAVSHENVIAPPFGNLESNIEMNGTLAARRQSMVSFDNMNMPDMNTITAAPSQLHSLHEQPPCLPGAFSHLFDESGLPTRRSSTSVINTSHEHQRQSPAFQPIAPRPSARAKPPIPNANVVPLAISSYTSSPSSTSSVVQQQASQPLVRKPSVDEGPILGGLQRGSIQSKRFQSPTSALYQPYPQPHNRNYSTTDIMKNFDSTH